MRLPAYAGRGMAVFLFFVFFLVTFPILISFLG